ncbi:FAD-dependent oxidoreductase [Patescibacteria group bacterium]|nr:FAD-dependent oxidoreductase [Patescibacteria group bacterium]
MYQLIIIGGGPGGISAGIYAARKKIKTLLIAEEFGGQSAVSDDVQNWIGDQSISGFDLAKKMEAHLKAHKKDIEIVEGDRVVTIKKIKEGRYRVSTQKGEKYETENILLVSGSRRRRLDVPGGEEFDGKGVAYCATCDAPLFKDKAVAVIGGGNSALEAVLDLLTYASKVYLIHRGEKLKGDAVTQDEIRKSEKVEIIFDSEVREIFGNKFVTGLEYKDVKTDKIKKLKLGGVFVEIGSLPNSDMVKDLVKLGKWGEVVVNHKTMQSSDSGIWAAGDVSDVLYKQNNISAGDSIKAVLNIYDKITGQSRK